MQIRLDNKYRRMKNKHQDAICYTNIKDITIERGNECNVFIATHHKQEN